MKPVPNFNVIFTISPVFSVTKWRDVFDQGQKIYIYF
jgi:hypothetical protein